MSKLLLVRHGITEFNSARRFMGYSDVELSVAGCRQVERLCDRLVDDKIDAVYSSDLRRALVTAEVLSSEHKVDIVTCPELREINYGDIEGLTFEEIRRLYPEVAELFGDRSLELKFPDGESVDDLTERVSKFLDRLKTHTPEQTILIVSHSGPLCIMVCYLLKIDLWHWRQFRIDLASLSIVDTYPQRAIISLLNGISHLR